MKSNKLSLCSRLPFLLGMILLIGTVTGWSQTLDWNNPIGGDFLTAENWSPASVPTTTSNVDFKNINSSGTYTITFDSDVEVNRLWVRTGNQTFDLGGHTLLTSGSSVTFGMGFDANGGSGTTTFQNGTVTNRAALYIGGGSSNAGRTVRFDNVDLSLKNAAGDAFYAVTVGISTEGSVQAGRQNNTLEITGESMVEAYRLVVGGASYATGNTVTIDGGSQVALANGVNINVGNTTTLLGLDGNTLEIDGDLTAVSARFLQVGGASSTNGLLHLKGGTLTISDAPGATANYLLVSGGAGNKAVIDGGALIVENTAGTAYIRAAAGTAGIEINGGTIRTDQLRRLSGDAAYTFNGGTISSRSANHVGGQFTVGNGTGTTATYEMLGNGTHTFSTLLIKADGQLIGTGTIVGNVTAEGELSPGVDSIGAFSIIGDLTISNTALTVIELAGGTSGNWDSISLTGTLVFNGTLRLMLTDGYIPILGSEYQIFDAESFSGNFASFDFSQAGLNEGLSWSFDAQSGRLSVVPEPSAALLLICGLCALTLRKRMRSSYLS